MLVLLTPSESRAAGRRGAAVRVEDLSFPELTEPRLEVLTALEQVSRRDDALAVLGAGPSLALSLRDLPERARYRARSRLVVVPG